MAPASLTSHLLSLDPATLNKATHSPFLLHAASGTLNKHTISNWLANDRLYTHAYLRLAAHLLRSLSLPASPAPSDPAQLVQVRLVDWLVDALKNIRREEKWFVDVAARYGIPIDLTGADGRVDAGAKIAGLQKFEALVAQLTQDGQGEEHVLPWLEGVVVFWATEKVYHEAWKGAKERAAQRASEQTGEKKNPEDDADGGAMRTEFIPNWTNEEFGAFVEELEGLLNEGVKVAGEGVKEGLRERAEKVWREVLEAEVAFWPVVEE